MVVYESAGSYSEVLDTWNQWSVVQLALYQHQRMTDNTQTSRMMVAFLCLPTAEHKALITNTSKVTNLCWQSNMYIYIYFLYLWNDRRQFSMYLDYKQSNPVTAYDYTLVRQFPNSSLCECEILTSSTNISSVFIFWFIWTWKLRHRLCQWLVIMTFSITGTTVSCIWVCMWNICIEPVQKTWKYYTYHPVIL